MACAEKTAQEFPCIKRWDSAPELPGAKDFAGLITSKGVLAAQGHTTAGYHEVAQAYESGYMLATHFYNAMTTSHKEGIFIIAMGHVVDLNLLQPRNNCETMCR